MHGTVVRLAGRRAAAALLMAALGACALLGASRTAALVLNYRAPMDVYALLPHVRDGGVERGGVWGQCAYVWV